VGAEDTSKNGKKTRAAKDRMVPVGKGVYVVRGGAPKTGTRLTKSGIRERFRSLNGQDG